MDRTLGDLLAGLERAVLEAEPPTIALLLGELERLKALLWHRLAAEIARTAPAPPAGGLDELRHLTPQQVGELLNLKPAYVHELCRTGRMPAVKSGKYWMIPVAGLRQWAAYRKGDVDPRHPEVLESLNPNGDTGRVRTSRPGLRPRGR